MDIVDLPVYEILNETHSFGSQIIGSTLPKWDAKYKMHINNITDIIHYNVLDTCTDSELMFLSEAYVYITWVIL
jgi:hypothetical protein